MRNKQRFTFLIRPDEREALKDMARKIDRSEAATLRLLIREAARGLLTPDGDGDARQCEGVNDGARRTV